MKSGKVKSNKPKQEIIHKDNTIFKTLLRIIKAPLFAILMAVLAIIFLVVAKVIPEYSYQQQSGKVKFKSPENFCTSDYGRTAIVDGGDSIYCLDEEGELIYAVDAGQFPYDNIEIIGVTFHNNDLYCQIAVYNKEAYLTDREVVWQINSSGELEREVIHYDYSETDNPPSHRTRISGIHFNQDRLCYLYSEETGSYLMEINLQNLHTVKNLYLHQDEFSKIIQCQGIQNGGYLILKNNGEIAFISENGKYKPVYNAKYNLRTGAGLFPYRVYMKDDVLYMLAGQGNIALYENLALYEWNGADWERAVSITDSVFRNNHADIFAMGLGNYNHQLALNINSAIYIFDDNLSNVKYDGGFTLPFSITSLMWLKTNLFILGMVFLIISIITGMGNLMKWRFSILLKQLLTTIPIILVLLTVITVNMIESMISLNTDDIIRETIGINEIAAALFDGEELGEITGFESVNSGEISNLNKKLREFVNGNKSYWSKNYLNAIFVRTVGESYVCVASSDEANDFMVNNFSSDIPVHEAFIDESHTLIVSVTYGGNEEDFHLVLATPIYREDGSYDAIMVLSASRDSLFQEIIKTSEKMLLHILVWVSLLILAITLVSAYNVRALRKAQTVVSRIADGDFSARIDKYPKDETGEICAGVNHMADRLSEYMNEKSRNEQFYYKFVPEKFKELLHKERFTDLTLGDAQSEDLTILFCDIRAFSLNSEMMTARESFEFVNRIYGKAGPIIRKYNGFVDKYIGDAVMALFESADDAVLAGIELYHAIVLNTDTAKELGISSVNVGIGIHSGMARIGIVGEEERMSGTVISNTVNISSRMESLTKKYGTAMIISKDTLDRMKHPDMLTTRYLGMVQVAGVNEVVSLYEVLDCLPDIRRQKRERTKNEFREAVRLYHSGELNRALEILQRLAEADDEDKASQLYVQYIQNKLAKGDTQHNVFRFERKQ